MRRHAGLIVSVAALTTALTVALMDVVTLPAAKATSSFLMPELAHMAMQLNDQATMVLKLRQEVSAVDAAMDTVITGNYSGLMVTAARLLQTSPETTIVARDHDGTLRVLLEGATLECRDTRKLDLSLAQVVDNALDAAEVRADIQDAEAIHDGTCYRVRAAVDGFSDAAVAVVNPTTCGAAP